MIPREHPLCGECQGERNAHQDFRWVGYWPDKQQHYLRTYSGGTRKGVAPGVGHKYAPAGAPSRRNRRSTFKQSRTWEKDLTQLFADASPKFWAVQKGRAGSPDTLVGIVGCQEPFLVVEDKHGNLTPKQWADAHDQAQQDAARLQGRPAPAVGNRTKPGPGKKADEWIRMRAIDFAALCATLYEAQP